MMKAKTIIQDSKNNSSLYNRSNLVFAISILLIILFAYTAIMKFLEYDKFVFQMRLAPISILHQFAPFLAWFVPSLESLIILLLLFDKYRLKGLKASFSLLLIFSIYIIAMLSSGLKLPCTCGGIISGMSWQSHLIFNAFFAGLALLAIKLNLKT